MAKLQKDSHEAGNLLKQANWEEKEKLKKLQNDFAEVIFCGFVVAPAGAGIKQPDVLPPPESQYRAS